MISHAMDSRQVNQVLTQFEATTEAIRGIETKVDRVHSYIATVQSQRETLTRQTETATTILDNVSDTVNVRSDQALEWFTGTLDTFAGLVESLEMSLYELRLQDAPRQIQREFGPLLMPAVVLVLIVTVSNCVFGFLLARDRNLSESFDVFETEGSLEGKEAPAPQEQLNILSLFAIFHVVLIVSAVLFIVIEGCRKLQHSSRHQGAAGVPGPDSGDEAASTDSRSMGPRQSRRDSVREVIERRRSLRGGPEDEFPYQQRLTWAPSQDRQHVTFQYPPADVGPQAQAAEDGLAVLAGAGAPADPLQLPRPLQPQPPEPCDPLDEAASPVPRPAAGQEALALAASKSSLDSAQRAKRSPRERPQALLTGLFTAPVSPEGRSSTPVASVLRRLAVGSKNLHLGDASQLQGDARPHVASI